MATRRRQSDGALETRPAQRRTSASSRDTGAVALDQLGAETPTHAAASPATRALTEFGAIDILRRGLESAAPLGAVVLGIGDDAAVLAQPKGELVCSVDASVEGVHFDLSWLSLEMAAARAFQAAVSDLAAMGATPMAALVALEAPRGTLKSAFRAIARGQARASKEAACPLVGGNITRGERFGFTTTVLGTCVPGTAVPRSGARVGDEVWLSAPVGWAALGLCVLQQERVTFSDRRFRCSLVGPPKTFALRAARRWATPLAALETGKRWAGRASSMIDISDSLASEAQHLATASAVRLTLDASLLKTAHSELFRAAQDLGQDPWPLVLYGGEEYVLLATGPAAQRPAEALVVGYVDRGRGAHLSGGGRSQRLAAGFDHLRPAARS